MKLCTVCGVVTSRPGSRCTVHARASNRSRHNALYGTRSWQRVSARVLRAWRGEHGDWCPGYARSAHPARDLTVDHVVPLAAGGAPFDIGNCAVLCRSCNSTKGASSDRGGVDPRVPRTLADRDAAVARDSCGAAADGHPFAAAPAAFHVTTRHEVEASATRPRPARGPGRPPWTAGLFWARYREACARATPPYTYRSIAPHFETLDGTRGTDPEYVRKLVRKHGLPPDHEPG